MRIVSDVFLVGSFLCWIIGMILERCKDVKRKDKSEDMTKISKDYFCEHSVELVVKHKQLFSRCVKCGAMWKMKEGEVNGKL